MSNDEILMNVYQDCWVLAVGIDSWCAEEVTLKKYGFHIAFNWDNVVYLPSKLEKEDPLFFKTYKRIAGFLKLLHILVINSDG